MTAAARPAAGKLTLGPLLFNWPAARRRDFYFRIADEAPVDTVCLREVVCAKRCAFIDPALPQIAERLVAGGKEVAYSTLALVIDEQDRRRVRDLVQAADRLVEANDLGALGGLAGRPHLVGPFINVYGEATLAWFAGRGARRVSLPVELDSSAIAVLAALVPGIELEVSVFGRLPLALSARCHHARAHGLHKDGCRYVCGEDPDGLAVETLDGSGFLAVNGLQTLSHDIAALTQEILSLRGAGVGHFRLWAHAVDMVAVARLYRDLLDGRLDPADAAEGIATLAPFAPIMRGFRQGGPATGRLAVQ